MIDCSVLVGRKWNYGVNDCWTMIQDYYKLLGISLPDHERPTDLATLTESMYLERMPQMGFHQIDLNRRRTNDVLIMQIMTQTPMHAAVFLLDERGNEKILHNKKDSISSIEQFGLYYRQSTVAVFRYAAERPIT